MHRHCGGLPDSSAVKSGYGLRVRGDWETPRAVAEKAVWSCAQRSAPSKIQLLPRESSMNRAQRAATPSGDRPASGMQELVDIVKTKRRSG